MIFADVSITIDHADQSKCIAAGQATTHCPKLKVRKIPPGKERDLGAGGTALAIATGTFSFSSSLPLHCSSAPPQLLALVSASNFRPLQAGGCSTSEII